jgi:arginine decarboxylase
MKQIPYTNHNRYTAAQLSPERAQELSDALEAGLTGYTYLSDEPLV